MLNTLLLNKTKSKWEMRKLKKSRFNRLFKYSMAQKKTKDTWMKELKNKNDINIKNLNEIKKFINEINNEKENEKKSLMIKWMNSLEIRIL